MDMSLVITNNKTAFAKQLALTIAATMAPKASERLSEFAGLFFDHFPIDELAKRDIHDVVGMLKSCYSFLEVYKQKRPKVRIFNPTMKKEGWTSNNTIVTVHYNDIPFMIDSVRMAIINSGITIKSVNNLVLSNIRDSQGHLVNLSKVDYNDKKTSREMLIYLEIDYHHKLEDIKAITASIRKTMADVNLVNRHYRKIVDELQHVRDHIGYSRSHHTRKEIYETNQFIAWLIANNFTFLGYAFYEFKGHKKQPALARSYGLLSKEEDISRYFPADEDKLKVSTDPLLTFKKAPIRSTIHRRAYPDHITIQDYDAEGHFIGVHHIVGLYTSQVYRASVDNIPVLRQKIEEIYKSTHLSQQSHIGKVLRQVLETFPRDELFQSGVKKLGHTLLGITQINERSIIRLFMRKSSDNRFVSAMVYIPRDKFSTSLREKIIAHLSEAVGAESSDFYSYYSESILSRTYVIFRLAPGVEKKWSESALEHKVKELASSWTDSLDSSIYELHGEECGKEMVKSYCGAFPRAYQDHFSVQQAVNHIAIIQTLSPENPIALRFSYSIETDNTVIHFKVFSYGAALPLSDVIPVLERMNLKVIGEHPYHIRLNRNVTGQGKESVWLHDFLLHSQLDKSVCLSEIKCLFEEAFMNIWQGNAENDFFNGLILTSQINWREVAVLRAYAAYMKQTAFPFSKKAIVKTLMAYPRISQQLIELFVQRFDPSHSTNRTFQLEHKLEQALESISSLNDDRILRHYLRLIQGTLRTNYFQQVEGKPKTYFSFKFMPGNIPDIPEPRPMFEIFVYSPRVEGVHLRGGKVARGGLRWSDRQEDFRTEVLGLVKAQNVKNAVIVPNGAKGGFVAKKARMEQGRDAFMKEGISCYKTFISALLDITDNLSNGQVIAPSNVVRHDDDDPYLVVAADKGTATFSDIANEISLKYGHWLGDAFASGGSQGYDHKGMGITAKGAWVSVQRHFKEMGTNVQKEDFSVIGIGDMAGDVFGNGMLMSKHIGLTAAFNHLHIFIDPNPNAAASYKERERLFNTPGATWEDYNKKLLSKGGGVFSRNAKSISISPEMQERFDIRTSQMTPTDLINALLKAPVDLIWNGGIGTYIKSQSESHSAIGDKANDNLRVNGNELRCKVFGEGGNLGMSQLGRIEYCMQGGRCNTDFIDNAAGVDCSDHEVNIKILLSEVIANGRLTEKQRNRLLASMTDTVSQMVLENNYNQTQAISFAEKESLSRVNEYRRLINTLETSGRLNRALEFIPSDEEIVDRVAEHHALTRPELAVLNCYVKAELKESLAVDDIADNNYLSVWVEKAFPPQLLRKYQRNIHNHILRKEIIATQLANDMVDNMGMTFCHRMIESTGEKAPAVAMAYVVARDVFQFDEFKSKVEALDFKVHAKDQLKLLSLMMRRVRRGTRWFLRNHHNGMDLQKTVDIFKTKVAESIQETPAVLNSHERATWQEKCAYFEGMGLDHDWSMMMSMPGHLFSGLGIAEAGLQSKKSIQAAVVMHHLLGDKLGFYWFAHAVTDVKVENFWQAMARESFIDDIDKVLRVMTIGLLRLAGKKYQYEEVMQLWMQDYPVVVSRWRDIAHDLQTNQVPDFAMFSVAMRELAELADICQNCKKLSCD
ncbi:hypothetical protein AB835_10780 [Candidatus Endobugula sertula]|uniref:Uncharacterized protein n=1 Tax=Candidatus Endobugula sertula TaxID=62101 RepID=A0A1D2QNB6_9GAMM|nr:hypothetical protein AB835_10780 [Candidatus Endobugula sertula]